MLPIYRGLIGIVTAFIVCDLVISFVRAHEIGCTTEPLPGCPDGNLLILPSLAIFGITAVAVYFFLGAIFGKGWPPKE